MHETCPEVGSKKKRVLSGAVLALDLGHSFLFNAMLGSCVVGHRAVGLLCMFRCVRTYCTRVRYSQSCSQTSENYEYIIGTSFESLRKEAWVVGKQAIFS